MILQKVRQSVMLVETLCRFQMAFSNQFRSLTRSASEKSAGFRQLSPSVLTPKFKNRLAGRKFLPGSGGRGFPEFLAPPRTYLPYALQAETAGKYSIAEWAQMCQEQLDAFLPSHGAVMFRGVPLGNADDFAHFTKKLQYTAASYAGGTGNRTTVGGHHSIYVSTYDPPSYSNELHNEMACSPVHPQKVIFFCLREPKDGCGGVTPIAQNHDILARLDRGVVAKLKEKKIRYSRYLPSETPTSYVSWQQSFATDDAREVEKFLERQGFSYEWDKDTGALSYWYTLPPFMKHPVTGEDLWFNQATVHHCTYYSESPMYQGVHLADDKYPTHTTYGDGTTIEPEVLQHIRANGWHCAVGFQWKTGDLLVLDNLRIQHGKLSFTGERKILAYLTKD